MKFTKFQLVLMSILFLALMAGFLGWITPMHFPGDPKGSTDLGFFHIAILFILFVGSIVAVIWLWCDIGDNAKWLDPFLKDKHQESPLKPGIFKFKKWFLWCLVIVAVFYSVKGIIFVSKDMMKTYNNSVQYHAMYLQNVQEKEGFYDKMWKTYLQKDKITNLNRETFIKVTKLIMENRKDGSSVAWKWLQENQQIPYEQFTVFYADLSNFIESQREGYFQIEKICQKIAYENNVMLATFPNNLYNKVLHCKDIQFEYGFLSTKTKQTFKDKVEDSIF